jgi:hypothetical protein
MRATPRLRWLVVFCAAFTATCAEKIAGPTPVASVVLTSNIGNRLAVGRNASVTAVARDGAGATLPGAAFTWGSSAAGVAAVTQSGGVSGVGIGSATITATADGVSATIAFQVSTPDFAGISAAIAEPLMTTLVLGLSTSVRTRTQAALVLCTSGTNAGDFTVVESCITGVRAEATNATDGTDKALLATIALFIDQVDRLLRL